MKRKSDCPRFVETPTNPEVCGKWLKLPGKEPFCQVEEKCPSLGLRLTPRADQEDDGYE